MKNIASDLIKVISNYDICPGIKSEKAKNQPFVIQYEKHLMFFKILLFHFIKSLCAVQFHVCF